jgi:hypothetical protein
MGLVLLATANTHQPRLPVSRKSRRSRALNPAGRQMQPLASQRLSFIPLLNTLADAKHSNQLFERLGEYMPSGLSDYLENLDGGDVFS